MTKSFFEEQCDRVHAYLATKTGQAIWNEAPLYRYGAKDFSSNEGTTPRVRYRLAPTFTLRDRRDTPDSNVYDFEQEVILQVWGSDEDNTIDLLGQVCQAHREVNGTYFGDVEGDWLNQDESKVGQHGFMVQVPLKMRCRPINIGSGNPVVLKHASTDIQANTDTDPETEDGIHHETVEDHAP